MNTPTHVLLNLTVLDRGREAGTTLAVAAGAILPDLLIVGFYAFERLIRHQPERRIWGRLYFQPGPQALVDTLHAFPVIALLALLAAAVRSRAGLFFCASLALHALADFLTHHSDPHHAFFPLSQWALHSPVSYWNPGHHAWVFQCSVLILAVPATAWQARRYRASPWRLILLGVTAAAVVLFACVAVLQTR